jgi:V/A-type H+-transporting ATPase subunit I
MPAEDVPVLFQNNFLIKPFELLINSYGVPCYGTLDPTAFVAIAFLLMFGCMFGDLGQGLVLAAIGALMWHGKSQALKQAGTLIFYCGISAAIFGILFGSVFGFEFHPFWMKPIENITELFKVAIIFGIIVISSGILFNITNAIRTRDLGKLFFDKAGLVAGLIYWTGIAIALKIFVAQSAVPPAFLYIIGAGLLVILLKPILELLFGHKKEGESLGLAMAESSVDLLEIVMGYLANTVSFIRVAAFALAHAGLFIAVFQLAKLVSGWGGSPASYILIALGNVGIIALEGLLVTIQSVRLNYYEFFSKFFISGKQEFKPLSL